MAGGKAAREKNEQRLDFEIGSKLDVTQTPTFDEEPHTRWRSYEKGCEDGCKRESNKTDSVTHEVQREEGGIGDKGR